MWDNAAVTIAYLTHPLGDGDDADNAVRRADNMAGGIDWFRYLVMHTRWAIQMPWWPFVVAIDDVYHRPRALRDQRKILERCDMLVLVGGWISPHMLIERRYAEASGRIPVLDLTDLGSRPPWATADITGNAIVRRAAALGVS